jgi:hypothetical protein
MSLNLHANLTFPQDSLFVTMIQHFVRDDVFPGLLRSGSIDLVIIIQDCTLFHPSFKKVQEPSG